MNSVSSYHLIVNFSNILKENMISVLRWFEVSLEEKASNLKGKYLPIAVFLVVVIV